ncbi:MAG: hypothetical protein UR18_C0006G0016 [Candidatus Nomurabacteria bacterium GW2011_GWE2_31_40]|nr:MAG: hypothetical protein UR18_C0006G0016 [Candidatus Nomurabacteria bacterium GW2011_GWE2_31_40]OGV06208.1 MAG: hypothetical protein A2299_12280 [Stygiobacter sp. RIFOXYB2_FULL_37_11]OGV15958.1 MAG: hypothetical protein A2440_03210 [Stygiobacter sp. RIFOXYC2_FULL_38_25]OGV27902.1 MAG: hypothetical protein A2499_17315 [Stygiobacter sp. RIFOXYC12_FULL_38_8]OGV80435.1 MAG: hypothetical protein A2X65_04370 [Stygiobacter sp. GWF2_38_21]
MKIIKGNELKTGTDEKQKDDQPASTNVERGKDQDQEKEKNENQKADVNEKLKDDQEHEHDQDHEKEKDMNGYEFEFKFVESGKEIEKKILFGSGNEADAIKEARSKADEYSAGKFEVVFTGNFKKIISEE